MDLLSEMLTRTTDGYSSNILGSSVIPEDSTDLSIIDEIDPETEDLYLTEFAENSTKSNIFKDIRKFANDIAEEIKNDPNHGYLLLSLLMAIIWGVYIFLYNSRLQGCILTTVLKRFIKKGDLKVGSISISLLWGKLMFRDVVYVTEDYSFRVVDAIVQFHYWLPYVKKKIHEDMSKCDHRMWIELNGLELHLYNRSNVYSKLEEIFGLDPQIIPKQERNDDDDTPPDGPVKDMKIWSSWRDLIPVIKIDLNMARFVFGNRLIPSTLLLTTDKAECFYSTKPAACSQDFFMHVVQSKAENFKVILAPSPKYTGTLDEPPRFMGEGFVVMSSSKIQFYYYMDETGIVPAPSQNLLIPTAEEIPSPPVWGLDIKCEKGTNLSYGPWADRQREQLFKFFFPQDYQRMEVSRSQAPGEIRQAHQFDVRLSILQEATVDILFTKEKETNAVHMTCQKGTYFEMTLPWFVKKEGYIIRINGQFLYLDASTSLQYRSLFEAESFKYEVNIKYPLIWNSHQTWDLIFTGSKLSYHFLYTHKQFFHDLIEDWSCKVQPDIMHFVPYTLKFHVNFTLFELITLSNEYNWVDCSSQHHNNAHVAICGDSLELKFNLPSVNFLPEVVPLKFLIVGNKMFLSLFLPPSNTTASIVESLNKNANLDCTTGEVFTTPEWRKFCNLNAGWVDCWQVPELMLNLGYTYHPMPPIGPLPQANVSTPEKLEILLSPIRAPNIKKTLMDTPKVMTCENFDSMSLAADTFCVELQIIRPSEIKLFGSILRNFIHLKENIFGEDQKFIDMSEPSPYDIMDEGVETTKSYEEKEEDFDGRKYRPFEVTVFIDIRNVRGHLMKDCASSDPACPTLALDGLIFEMNKQYQETQMQVVLSPLILTTYDNNVRHQKNSHLHQGHLVLSGLQMRGHAMFSNEGQYPWEETLEYSWLVELTIGTLSGKLTTPQLQYVLTGLETFIFSAVDTENCLRHPRPYNLCYHGEPQPDCSFTLPDHFCPTVDVIKYKMLRVSLDAIDFHLVEAGTDLNLQVFPIRISTCNLHGQHTRSGITAHIENIRLKNYVCGWVSSRESRHSNQDSDGRAEGGGPSHSSSSNQDVWIEAAVINLGPLYVDAAVSSNILHHDMQLIQHDFLKKHDVKTSRLWFLWPQDVTKVSADIFGKCGCVGGCNFIGVNRNGPLFFKPSKQDFVDGLNVAQFKINVPGKSPGYGQSILKDEQLVFEASYYSSLTQCQYGSTLTADKEHMILSSGYTKSTSPAIDLRASRRSSLHQPANEANQRTSQNNSQLQDKSFSSQSNHGNDVSSSSNDWRKHSTNGISRIGGSSSLGRQTKEVCNLSVPVGECVTSPGSLSDLRVDDRNGSSIMKPSLSLQAEFPSHSLRNKHSDGRSSNDPNKDMERVSITSVESPPDPLGLFSRTVSVGSEALSEAFYSADEDQMISFSQKGNFVSPAASLMSFSGVPESSIFDQPKNSTLTADSNLNDFETSSRRSNSRASNSSKSSSSSCHSSSSSTGTCDYRSGNHGHSQTSLLHSSGSDISIIDEINFRPKPKKPSRIKSNCEDLFSEVGSVSSNSFISAVSSQEDIALVNLHMQLNKPITESPLLMSSYINHMTQLRCINWDAPSPTFVRDRHHSQMVPTFEKMSEGFTAIRMVEGTKYVPLAKSPTGGRTHSPNHPYSWDTPVFTWGDSSDNQEFADEVIGAGLSDSNTTRTTVVMKLKKDIDMTISPIALESAQRFIDALTPVLASLHPLTIVNRTHFRSVASVEGKNTLKKDRYMYWSRLRDGKKCGTPEQGPVVTSTYQESCFQQVQGQISIPRVNFTLLQASVVEEVISFSALDNIRDLTCVSLFSFCLDGVNLQFYSGHQSNQSVQIFMRNPRIMGKPKKTKSKMKQTVDLFSEPVYIETSEKQQEENMISVSVKKLHVQLRRLKNESSLLKDASITAIPNHRSKVMFSYRRCDRGSSDGDPEPDNTYTLSEEERMGFIMFEAGLENVALKAVKRKGFNDQLETKMEGPSMSRRESTQPCGNWNGPSSSGNSNPGAYKGASRTNSAPTKNKETNGGTPSTGPPHTAPPCIATPFSLRKSTPEVKQDDSISPSQGSSATAHSNEVPHNNKEETPNVNPKCDKKDITSFSVELSTVWFNFAAPPHTPITKKIDYTRLDWNFLSTASPSINAWMNPSDRLTVTIINFLHSSETRRLGVIASLMEEALEMPSIHVPPKNKYSKLIPLSQTVQEDPSCQLCNVLRRYLAQSSLEHIEANLNQNYMPKLATLRQGVVVLSRQWKSALYMPLLMEQTFKYKQSHPVYSYRSASHSDALSNNKLDPQKIFEEKFSYQHDKDMTPLSNIDEGIEFKEGHLISDEGVTDYVMSSVSSHLPPRHSLPSFPPRSATASAIIPSSRNPLESPPWRFHFPKFGLMLEETMNFFRSSSTQRQVPAEDQEWKGSIPDLTSAKIACSPASSKKSHKSGSGTGDHCSLISNNEDEVEPPKLPKEDLYLWMARQQEHNLENAHTVNFNKGLDLPNLSEGSEVDDQEDEVYETSASIPLKSTKSALLQEPQPAHFLEAHVIFEPLLSAIGVITQQVTGGALEQLGANVSVTASVETLRMDIIESEASRLNRKKRKTGLHSGNSPPGSSEEDFAVNGKFFLDISSDVPSFICEKMVLEIDICKVADESRGWVCQQPTLFVSRSALKQHTSTMVHFSLNVNYIAQQVNMPLLRLLHQISSMYQNARQTQLGLKEQRPTKSKNISNVLPQHSKESLSELNEGAEYKNVEYSLSLSEEQGTLSSIGGTKGQRGSVVSSLSNRAPSPSQGSSNQGTFNRLGRPQSFAQKLKSTTKITKGYRNLVREKETHSPLLSVSVSGSALGDAGSPCSDKSPLLGSLTGQLPSSPTVPLTPKCWRNICYLVDLYATTPETKTVQQRPVVGEIPERYKSSVKSAKADVESGLPSSGADRETSILADKVKDSGFLGLERTPLVIFGVAKIQKTKLLASLSGLKLEAEMNAMHSSITFREKVKGNNPRSSSELSLTGHIGSSMIVLLEGIAPNQQTVVRVTINKSQGLYSSLSRKAKEKNLAWITIGPVEIDIPQHPIILHDMMTRGTKQLSSTLQELRVTRPSRLSRGTTVDEGENAPSPRPTHEKTPEPLEVPHVTESLLHPLAIQFSILLQEMSIHAALLPSLQATYCMQQLSSDGVTGSKAKFNVHLPTHHLAFSTKFQEPPSESSLPPSAKIGLPKVMVKAQYILDDSSSNEFNSSDGMVLREGNYLKANVEIGSLEHFLTTDLLNHLVFVQKVFMKEVNEVVQKMAGSDKPVPLWSEEGSANIAARPQRLLFAFEIKLKGIIITATTPTQSAVRLETGSLELQLSNRVENVGKRPNSFLRHNQHTKIFGQAQVDITLALGQLIRNELFDEVEPELQQLAYFRTRVCLRNAFHDELTSVGDEGEIVLITLTRPLICIQPLAVDRAVLVWLNYKNAYEYWNEQRASLNKEVLTATQQVFEKVPQFSSLSAASTSKSNIFLKLTVNDIGICLPLNPCRTISHQVDSTETKDALVVTLDSTIITACNSGSLVFKAHFQRFCTRFAPEFETSLDEWKPDYKDLSNINLCMVSEGTYEVCSRTVAQNPEKGNNAKWLLNVQWQMEGVELHLDVNIGKHLSSLARTLTMLTGVPDVGHVPPNETDSEGDDKCDATIQDSVSLPTFIFDPSLGPKERAKLLEIEMNEQAKTVNVLKTLGASASTVEQEIRRLEELEKIVSSDFRRDVLMKIRRQSIKATSMKDRLGLGPKLHMRSKSIKIPSPTMEVQEPSRHYSNASESTDSNPPPSDDVDGDVFLSTPLSSNSTSKASPNYDLEAEINKYCSSEVNVKGPEVKKRIVSPQNSLGHSFTSGQGSAPVPGFKQTDPSIDLELDVKVSISSGECVLFNKDFAKDEETKCKMKKERSFSGGIHDMQSSPGSIRKKSDLRNLTSTSKLKAQTTPHLALESTSFFIPGLDVKVHYESHNIHEDTPISGGKGSSEDSQPGFIPSSLAYSRSSKTSSMGGYTSPPPFPSTEGHSSQSYGTKSGQGRPTGLPSSFNSSLGSTPAGTGSRRIGIKRASLFTWLTLQSIPDETMISPSILDFMEKVLEPIPEPSKTNLSSPISTEPEVIYNLDMDSTLSGAVGSYSYASFPVDVIVYFHMQPSTIRFSCQPVSRVECLLTLPSLNAVFSSKRAAENCGDLDCGRFPSAMGGLSVTGALADFSLFVFHPYGGKNRGARANSAERKDSLKVIVEFVKFNIARSRKIDFKQENQSAKLKTSSSTDGPSKAIIRFSTIIDIGAAFFKYDMRRLTEILAFPRAWYRRTIVRRLFLGDMTSRSTAYQTDDISPAESSHGIKRHSSSSIDVNAPGMTPTGPPTMAGSKVDNSNWKRVRMESTESDAGVHHSPKISGGVPLKIKENTGSWETLVQFAVNFTKLQVQMNIGNVMGNAEFTTNDFKANGRLSLGSTGHKNLYISLGLGGSCMEAKGGIVGGTIDLTEINMYLKIREDPDTEPDHVIGIKLFASQARLDYMGTSVLMARVSSFSVTLKDEWKLKQCAKDEEDSTRRGATIFILGDLEWDQLQFLISKSTTADILKMHHKLEEFFTAQFKSSKRVFSSLQPTRNKPSIKSRQREANRKVNNVLCVGSDARHHRHWQKVLSRVSGLRLTTLPLPLPKTGTVLGGCIELHGKTIFLACFHGINFKSKSWALFSLKEPYINFTSEVQEIPGEASGDTHIVQNLTFSLGLTEQNHAQHVSMAKVCRITRNMVFPPQFRTIQEWFYYAFCTSDLDDVDRFPTLDGAKTDSLNSQSSLETKRSSSKMQEHNHSSETIFALPSMEVHLNTKHRQMALTPDITDHKPTVECSFVTEFQDHIFVTIDAENFFFLHDLINSYVKDTKDKMGSESEDKDGTKKAKVMKVNEPTQILQQDWREFTCPTWHLEPTVRLLSWATRNLEPYGVDYILNKLGFHHARTTIPKWLQRGGMDPLDKVLSVLMFRMIQAIHDHDAANR